MEHWVLVMLPLISYSPNSDPLYLQLYKGYGHDLNKIEKVNKKLDKGDNITRCVRILSPNMAISILNNIINNKRRYITYPIMKFITSDINFKSRLDNYIARDKNILDQLKYISHNDKSKFNLEYSPLIFLIKNKLIN